jgi:translocation and assembly module TamA
VQVSTPKKLDADGRLPVTFTLVERKPRTIGASIGYQTDEGPNTTLFWEHRNLFGAGEKLHTELDLSAVEQSLNAAFSKPAFLSRNQTLLANGALARQDTDAFDSDTASAGIGLQRELIKKLIVSGGVAYTYADIDDHTGNRQTYGLVSTPLTFSWDYSNDLLNPTRGGRTDLTTTPFVDTLGTGIKFLKNTVTQTVYVPLLSSPRLILALRGSAGSIAGASRGDVPAIERFYAGGGGSIRGIPYQKAGPLNDKDDPLGGRSLLEASSELRLLITKSLGVVAFVDSGNVYNSSVPDLSEPVEVGTGMGLRYLTPIGPLRFDIGVPVHPRKKVDDPYQLYIGIGQAF